MLRFLRNPWLLLIPLLVLLPTSLHAQDQVVVRAVLFYSPTCPHCHEVIQNGLPPIVEKYGDQLQIVLINTQTEGGSALFASAADWGGIPPEQRGVPLMVVGDELLGGSIEIPARLPDIVDAGLSAGGIDWPNFPGMAEVVVELEARENKTPAVESTQDPEAVPTQAGSEETTVQPTTGASTQPTKIPATVSPAPAVKDDAIALVGKTEPLTAEEMSMTKRFMVDPAGSTIAVVVLGLLIVSVFAVGIGWLRNGLPGDEASRWRVWVVPVLAGAGLTVAAYLAFVETTASKAVCGPVGDCNAVQQSPYAHLFGILPIGVLGVIGYLTILFLWLWQRYGRAPSTVKTAWMLPTVALFGGLFSIYLTFLEPFVIAAVCMWCITSAVIMLLLLWFSYMWRVPTTKGGH